jgi:hypothetical protein
MTPLLSVLIPSLPERADRLRELLKCIPEHPEVEILVLTDNRRRTLPAKRNLLTQMAQGCFLTHVDDDELLAPDYLDFVLPELAHGTDLVAYDAGVSFNGLPEFRVRSVLGAAIEHPQHLPDGGYSDITRPPWHWSVWRTDFARRFPFKENVGYGEDWTFLEQALPEVKTWRKIDRVLFHHRWNAETTTFPPA